ncbi:MAG: 3-hydroxyacyl-ACP dehydratase FabZ [Myxococcota bacterium]|nr:3-hydroxyacyl-ACP dehydratase FabZ [Myxococcota bacterium]
MLDFDEVRRLLPQTHPFIFIDRVLDLVPYESIECLKNVSGGEPYFAGHFPEVSIMPGALMMEACAQASILLFRLSAPGEEMLSDEAKQVFVVGTSRSHFVKPVVPGDSVVIRVDVERMFKKAAMVKAVATVEGERVLKASLSFARLDPASLHRKTGRGGGDAA